jgi:enoyl-CoA hydratase
VEDAEGVRYDVDGPVARVTIDREACRNALSWDVVRGLRAAVAAAGEDAGVRVLVLTGTGERAFCAGADLTGMAAGGGPVALHEARGELARLFEDLWSLGKPSIARVRGYALTGGFGLAWPATWWWPPRTPCSGRPRSTWACGRS